MRRAKEGGVLNKILRRSANDAGNKERDSCFDDTVIVTIGTGAL